MPDTVLDKEAFFKAMCYEPHSGQVPIHESAARRRVVACGVRWGKTRCAAMEGLAAAMAPAERSYGWVVAPTYDLADKVFREIELVVARHLKHRTISIRESDRRILLRNMGGGVSEIKGKSADNPVSLLGEGLDWVIIDEAARLKPAIWESHLSQRLIDRQGWALLISTPRGKGWFHELFQRGQRGEPDHASWNAPSWTNPHLNAEVIELERGRLPERAFLQEYGAQFIEGSGAVFRNVDACATGSFIEPVPDERYYAGLDLAKVEDFTVLVILNRQCQVVFVDRFHKQDWAIQVQRIQVAAERYNRARIIVDSTGAGEPIFESLRQGGCSVEPYTFTQKSKADLINNLALMLERQEIVLPRRDLWQVGLDELEAFEYSVTDSGSVRMSSPSGLHDDCVIAVALAAWQHKRKCWTPEQQAGFEKMLRDMTQRDDPDDPAGRLDEPGVCTTFRGLRHKEF